MNENEQSRLEEGLEQLQRLGYLQSPAEVYVARHLPDRGGALRSAAVTAVWVGAGGGCLVALVLWLTALLADPTLLDRPGDMSWLAMHFALVTANIGMLVVFLLTWPILSRIRRSVDATSDAAVQVAVLVPGILFTLYLTDALGRHFLPQLEPRLWIAGIATAATVASSLGALVTLFLAALVTVARMRLHGGWNPGRLRRKDRLRPWLLSLLLAVLLLLAGPYRGLRQLPRLDELDPPATATLETPLLVVAIDGLAESDLESLEPASTLRAWDEPGLSMGEVPDEHPGAFWNALATGFPSDVHGYRSPSSAAPRGVQGGVGGMSDNPILSTVLRHVVPGMGLGAPLAADQRELRRPQFWEIAAHAGRSATVINWWATYPAAAHPRLAIASDRWFLRLWESRSTAAMDTLLFAPRDVEDLILARPGRGPDLLQNTFAFRARRPAAQAGDGLLTRLTFPEVEGWDSVADTWAYATTVDAFHTLLARGAVERKNRDVIVLHLNGLDILHRRVAAAQPLDREYQGAMLQLLESYVTYLDQLVTELLTSFDGDCALIGSAQYMGRATREVWGGWKSQGGVEPLPGSVLQFAPESLDRLGVPPARDMEELLRPASGRGPRTYGRRPHWTPPAGRRSVDLDRLRSLGYVDG